jgi:DNA invertase Pin-like site-specific DNA recombinase
MTSIGYIRNSRLSQENSVETQKKLITDYCNTHDIHLDKIVVDEGISGSCEKTHKRDGYNSVMKMVEDGEVNNLVVISLSRWGRNLMEIYKSVELMNNTDTHFYSIK